ncbi:MAG: hypothetical protein COB38_04405 [Gammaproteobacteria bacterium]|nr:MAG: hypothetical protein COB38_04405 [Gammaproteobacteria bacterium]
MKYKRILTILYFSVSFNTFAIESNDKDEIDGTPTKVDETSEDPTTETREFVYQSAVGFANWVDSFFGQSEELEDADFDYLRLRNDFIFREGDSPAYRLKIKAKVRLPQLSNRVSLILSNEQKEGGSGPDDSTDLETISDRSSNSSAALNYETDIYSRSKFDFRVGLGSGLKPFSFARHTFQAYKSETLSIKNYNYLIWKEEDGTGLSTKIKLNKTISPTRLFRWGYFFLRAEKTRGNEWSTGIAIVDQLSDEKWIAYQLSANGETELDWDVSEYRLSLRYRMKTEIDWLFFEIEPAYSYVKSIEQTEGNFVPSIKFRFEIKLER